MKTSPELDAHHRGRRKGTGSRQWLVVSSGQSHVEEVGKHSIMKRTGLPARDLRVLDPLLSYPSTILGRERAIVINLEQIKAIVTATDVLIPNYKDPMVAPFVQELRARVSRSTGAHNQALILEKEAYPALDELTSKLSTLNLERVRQLKSRLVGISGRVQKVRDELEHLLDDDMDMAEMYLTEKLTRQPVGESTERVDTDTNGDELKQDDDRDVDIRSETESRRESLSGFKPNVEELEMLLEAYFVQIDGTLNKLSHLKEYIDDTEDYINIMLDDKQNQLLEMGVMLSTATLVLTAAIVVVSIFGMNITISLYDDATPTYKFWQTTFGTIGGCVGLYVMAVGWGKKRGLLQ